MGVLLHSHSGRSVVLGARTLVGRNSACPLRIDSRLVSNEHATIWWEAGAWHLRDVGSRNGTWLDGRRQDPGARSALPPGCVVVFGHMEHTWTLADAGPPVALARGPAGEQVVATHGALCLPSPEAPLVMVFEQPDGAWRAEGPDGVTAVTDGSVLVVGGAAWALHLPVGHASTMAPALTAVTMGAASLQFRVSQDEEYVEIGLSFDGSTMQLAQRAHFELLLVLARARIEDGAHPPAEQGWRYADEVQRMLGMDKAVFNLHVFRARQQLGELGVPGAAAVVERRASTGQLRLGFEQVEVRGLG